MIALKTVLVATDFSEPSAKALEYGRALARTFGATLHVLHVLQSTWVPAGAELGSGAAQATLLQTLEVSARDEMERAVREDDRRELNAQTSLLTSASPASAIVAHAKEIDADVIVIGTHGRSGLSHTLMGSVAEKVLRIAPCPVLTVGHAIHDFLASEALQVAARA
jgi:nucleotide-binding universal stress UspA family protein